MRATKSAAALFSVGTAMLALSAAGAARTEAVDVQLDIQVGPGSFASDRQPPTIPNGGTATVRGAKFVVGASLALVTAESASARIRIELPAGLSWGADFPDPTENCTSTPSTAECRSPALEPVTGGGSVGWGWDVVAAQPGSYVVSGEIVDASPPDSVSSNNASSVTIVVLPAAIAGSVVLTPAAPKAGATFSATVRVTAGGSSLTPNGIACRATLAGKALDGSRRATSGTAGCVYRTRTTAKGKVLRGTMSFNAGGTNFIRRFSTKLR